MNLEYTLIAAEAYVKNGDKATANGFADTAMNHYANAAKNYRTAAQLCPERKAEFIALAEKYENTGLTVRQGNSEKPAETERKQTETVKEDRDGSARHTEKPSLDEALEKLNSLVGLADVKNAIGDWVDQIKAFQIRKERGMKIPEMSYHLVFTGNPGTGKTTVARLIAEIYHALGILSEGHLTEVDRSELVAGYVGQTAIKTSEVLKKAKGGVLFIDEAYTLANGGENDFGREAIDTLLKAMEDNRGNLVVIAAGYGNLMERFINSNPGLRSRFKNFIEFSDYTGEELYEIFKVFCDKNEYVYGAAEEEYLRNYFAEIYNNRGGDFGNARNVRNFFELAVTMQSKRVVKIPDPSNEQIKTFILEDLKIK